MKKVLKGGCKKLNQSFLHPPFVGGGTKPPGSSGKVSPFVQKEAEKADRNTEKFQKSQPKWAEIARKGRENRRKVWKKSALSCKKRQKRQTETPESSGKVSPFVQKEEKKADRNAVR